MPTLVVRAKPKFGRSRAGLRFTREESIVDVTDEQEAAIRADDQLVVVEPKPEPAVASTEDTKTDEKKSTKR